MIQNILINLNILSKIKPYDKIYMNKDNLITIEYNSILQGIFRFLYSNSREKNLTNLLTFYQTVYSLIDELLNSQYLNNSSIKNFINLCARYHGSKTHFIKFKMDKLDISQIFLLSIITAKDSFFNLAPLQTGHGSKTMYFSISLRM